MLLRIADCGLRNNTNRRLIAPAPREDNAFIWAMVVSIRNPKSEIRNEMWGIHE